VIPVGVPAKPKQEGVSKIVYHPVIRLTADDTPPWKGGEMVDY